MFNKIGFGVAALAFCAVGVFANGCSSTSTSGGTTADGGGTTGDSGVKKDSGTGNPDGGATAPACFAAGSVTFPWGPATLGQNKCAPADITGFYDACLGGADAGAGADAGGICDDFILSHVSCISCIEGPLNSATVPDAGPAPTTFPAPVIFNGTAYTYVNADACVAAISSAASDTTCTTNFPALQNCARLECEGCIATDDANGTATTACENYALNDTSCSTPFPVSSTCDTAVNGVSAADQQSKCGLSSSGTFQSLFTAVATAFCGAP